MNNFDKCTLKLKLLAIDLDGTLLSSTKKISKTDLQALKDFSDNGGEIFISTGKSLDATKPYINKISNYIKKPLKYCSCLNGNIIYDIQENRIIHSDLIKNETCKKLYQVAKKHHIIFAPYTVDGMYSNTIPLTHSKFMPSFLNKLNLIFKFKFMERYQKMDAFKINLLSYSKKRMANKKFNSELDKMDGIEILRTNHKLFEVVKKGSNKGKALQIICDILNIQLKDVGSIGDSHNDLPMFKVSGKSFMVKYNSDPIFLKYVDIVTKSKRNKVAEVIYNYVLNK